MKVKEKVKIIYFRVVLLTCLKLKIYLYEESTYKAAWMLLSFFW
jgi:hypothetical protein